MKLLIKTCLFAALLGFFSCGKEFLDIKRNANQAVPRTIADYQAILDWNSVMNQTASFILACIGTDEYYVTDEVWNAISGVNIYQKNGYIWADDIYENTESIDWNNAYQRVLYANMALDVQKIRPAAEEVEAWNIVKGQALFHRAWAFYQLAQVFCEPYNESSADTDLGIPLRLEHDVTARVGRSSLRETYKRIIEDLHEALPLLPETALSNFRPSQVAAHALLSRIYLGLGDYELCLRHSTQALNIHDELLDYNTLDYSLFLTFSSYLNGGGNPEIIFYNHTGPGTILGVTRLLVDTNLYAMYDASDLRKRAFFNNDHNYIGRYSGGSNLFTGLAVDEVLLNRAESFVRLGDYKNALVDLNKLLRHRYNIDAFTPITESNDSMLLNIILDERRKELYMRGTRWSDLRRLNTDPTFATAISRVVNGRRYDLRPEDKKWTWPLPDNEIKINGLEQNSRQNSKPELE